MNTTQVPFIKWGIFQSDDELKPDILELQVIDPETFETQYSVNIRVNQNEDGKWTEKILPLKNHESMNNGLLKEWEKNARKDLTKPNKIFKLKTWLVPQRTEGRLEGSSWTFSPSFFFFEKS